MRKEFGYFDAKFIFDDALDVLVRKRFDLVLKPAKRFAKCFGNQICPAGEELAELNEGGPKAFEIIGQFLCPGGAVGRWLRRLVEPKAGQGTGGRIFCGQERNVFVALEVMQ